MGITAIIEGIKYKPILQKDLKTIALENFNVNIAPATCIVKYEFKEFALSRWVSPKRTRSYPYARVYDTISRSKRITVIPVIKDEGINGDRDFIQWDTISLMSLLEVCVIFSYYNQAEKNANYSNKITNQKFDNDFVVSKIRELSTYQSSALHWNLKELRETLPIIVQKQLEAYSKIAIKTGVAFRSFQTFKTFRSQLETDVNLFIESSRRKAQQAQSREILTIHGKEYLETFTKASITITNYIGGKYFFTVDEVRVNNG